ncbi:MAG: Rieske (2Fe-2S) protein [Dehalococcoidia bacterium]
MSRSLVARVTSRLAWLDPVASALQKAANAVLTKNGAATPLKSFLNGVWMAHPLHPALTDVPAGAWSATAVFDFIGVAGRGESLETAADATLALGIVGAAGAALAGIADWSDTQGETRRVGTLHALLNSAALGLNIWSLIRRRGGDRGAGVLLSTTALGVAGFAAYLGGDLVFTHGMGVNHQMWPEPPLEFITVMNVADLPEGKLTRAQVGDVPVCLLRQGNRIAAVGEWCTHLGGPLSEGFVEDGTISCPWHGSRFDLETGAVVRGPATTPAATFETRVRNGKVEVRATGAGQ